MVGGHYAYIHRDIQALTGVITLRSLALIVVSKPGLLYSQLSAKLVCFAANCTQTHKQIWFAF